MDERSSTREKRPHDFSLTAFRVVHEATDGIDEPADPPEPTPEERHAAAVALGRFGGKKGGKARTAKLTAEQRKAIAQKAAQARWGKREG